MFDASRPGNSLTALNFPPEIYEKLNNSLYMKRKHLIVSVLALAGAVFIPGVPAFAQAIPAHAGANATADVTVSAKNFSKTAAFSTFLPNDLKGSKIVATNFEQLVAPNGSMRFPISDKVCLVSVGDKDGKNARTLTVLFSTGNAGEGKPAVVPAIQEWAGKSGEFVLDSGVVIWCDPVAMKKNPLLEDYAKNFRKDVFALTGIKLKAVKEKPAAGAKAILLGLGADTRLGEEGYALAVSENAIALSGVKAIGVNWGAQTLLQVFKNSGGEAGEKFSFPCGNAADYPQYPLRGFSYDVGRKPATLQAVSNVARTMAYYKLNDLQLHLNDNFIWLHDYTKIPNGKDASPEDKKAAIAEVMAASPTGFRLESKVAGLTSEDAFYTKKDFIKLQENAESYGVRIVPELDIPGHAMSFVKVRPDLMYRGIVHKAHDVERAAMLDASTEIFDPKTKRTYREETLKFVQGVMDEYLKPSGKDGKVFRSGIVHIGTDEYYGNPEDYRAFADEMLKYVKSRGYTPRLWGSLSYKRGKTPVISDGVQMDIWSLGWQNPQEALDYGYDIINILDVHTYIVPSGTGSVGGYGDFLNLQFLYNPSWAPHAMGNQKVLPGHPKLLGAQFALWNDNSWRKDNGFTDYDLFDRIQKSAAVIAEKTWATGIDRSYKDFEVLLDKVDVPPGINPRYKMAAEIPASAVELKLAKCVNAEIVGNDNASFKLNGGKSFVKLPNDNSFAPDYKITLEVRRAKEGKGEEILFSAPAGTFKAVQKETGKVGFTRDAWDFSFDYVLPVGKTVELVLEARGRNVTLYADGVKIGSPLRHKHPESHKLSTLIFPMLTIGAPENAFNGDVKVKSVEKIESAEK